MQKNSAAKFLLTSGTMTYFEFKKESTKMFVQNAVVQSQNCIIMISLATSENSHVRTDPSSIVCMCPICGAGCSAHSKLQSRSLPRINILYACSIYIVRQHF